MTQCRSPDEFEIGIIEYFVRRIVSATTTDGAPFFVAICGWADTGKSTLATALCRALKSNGVDADCISTDAFLKDRAERNRLGVSGYNPMSVDAAALSGAVGQLSALNDYAYYPYDNRTGAKVSISNRISARSVVVVEGIHALNDAIRNRCSLRIFVDSDLTTLKALRRRANLKKRGMSSVDSEKYIDREISEYQVHVQPQKKLANIWVNVDFDFKYEVLADSF